MAVRTLRWFRPPRSSRAPSAGALGRILRFTAIAARRATRAAFEGRSSAPGPRPKWLSAATNLRFLGSSVAEQATDLRFELPTLGAGAAEALAHWDSPLPPPAPEATACELLAAAWADLAAGNRESLRLDAGLLNCFAEIVRPEGWFGGLAWTDPSAPNSVPFTPAAAALALTLRNVLPPPRVAHVVGQLEPLRPGAVAFELRLDDGTGLRCLPEGLDPALLAPLTGRRVMAAGRGIFLISGAFRHFAVHSVAETDLAGSFFSAAPKAIPRKLDIDAIVRRARALPGVQGIFGKWPGNETDEEIAAALREMS